MTLKILSPRSHQLYMPFRVRGTSIIKYPWVTCGVAADRGHEEYKRMRREHKKARLCAKLEMERAEAAAKLGLTTYIKDKV